MLTGAVRPGDAVGLVSATDARGVGVGECLTFGVGVGAGVGVSSTVGDGEAVADSSGDSSGVGVALSVGCGVSEGLGGGVAVGRGVGFGFGEALACGVEDEECFFVDVVFFFGVGAGVGVPVKKCFTEFRIAGAASASPAIPKPSVETKVNISNFFITTGIRSGGKLLQNRLVHADPCLEVFHGKVLVRRMRATIW